jgi:hypothetical protein
VEPRLTSSADYIKDWYRVCYECYDHYVRADELLNESYGHYVRRADERLTKYRWCYYDERSRDRQEYIGHSFSCPKLEYFDRCVPDGDLAELNELTLSYLPAPTIERFGII